MRQGSTGRPKLISQETVRTLQPVPLGGNDISEDRIQELLHAHPDLLPIEEISNAWGPLIPLVRELGISVGAADNLYVSPAGELTVVEAKLWRNPQSRREVVGQILDYAAALAAMTYEDFDSAVRACGDGRSIWELVRASGHAPPAEAEAAFVDTVSRNLRAGRFLLLVVGDGIRSDLHGIADLLAGHPTLGFHLELVELRIHYMPTAPDLLVVPHLVGRTEEVVRAVVEIRNPEHAKVTVDMTVQGEPPERKGKLRSLEEFAARSAETVGQRRAEAYIQLAGWWSDKGGLVKFGKESVNFWAPRPGTTGVPILTIYTSGEAQGAIGAITSRGLAEDEAVRAHYEAAGFSEPEDWPMLDFDPTIDVRRRAMTNLLNWAIDLVRSASALPH